MKIINVFQPLDKQVEWACIKQNSPFTVIAYSRTGELACLNLYTGRKLNECKSEPGRLLDVISYSFYLSAGFSNKAMLWDNIQAKPVQQMIGPASCTALKVVDANSFLVGYSNGQLVLWNVQGQQLMVAISGKRCINEIMCLQQEFIIVANDDGQI